MNEHFTYFIILTLSLAGPLALSFDKKIAFYKNWKKLFKAIIIPAIIYIIWDVYFTHKGIWSFNSKYIIGFKIFGLPIEEIIFFFVVPYCCMFIFECVHGYFPRIKNHFIGKIIFIVLAISLFVTGLLNFQKNYTAYTFILTATFIGLIYSTKFFFKSFNASLFLIVYLICLIPFLIVNGFLTSLPVVMYNNTQNLGIRIYTIPFEDIFYGMLLMLMIVFIYEKLK